MSTSTGVAGPGPAEGPGRSAQPHRLMGAPVDIECERGCWTFTLNVPERRNALSAAMVEALARGIAAAHADKADVLAFRGAGLNFSAGFDFTDVEAESEGELLLRFVRIESLLQEIANSPCVTVALAHGRNFGAGVDLFAACQQRLARPGTSFRLPGLQFGLILGTRRFADIVGRAKALEILQSTRTFDANTAAALGFVQRVLEGDVPDWPAVLDEARETAACLDPAARADLRQALSARDDDADLAALVRSAARPGLKQRIARYRSARF